MSKRSIEAARQLLVSMTGDKQIRITESSVYVNFVHTHGYVIAYTNGLPNEFIPAENAEALLCYVAERAAKHIVNQNIKQGVTE